MPTTPPKNLKLYYSIKEVADIIGVSEPTLRYWESEFSNLRPKTTKNKVRQYTEKDIEDVRLIYNLVKVKGLKIAAARKAINANPTGADATVKVLERLESIKKELTLLKNQLDSIV